MGPYLLQAEIDAVHARAETWADTDWRRIDRLYESLEHATNNPVVSLNRAVAHSYAVSPEAGLARLEPLRAPLSSYRMLRAAEADMLRRAGRREDAANLYTSLIEETAGTPEAALYERRRASLPK